MRPGESSPPNEALSDESDVTALTQRSALAYPEAVVIQPNDAYSERCTGVLVAPRVVLTAAHCVAFVTTKSWTVTAPFALGGAETHEARDAEPMDAAFMNLTRASYLEYELRDVGIIYIDVPFANVKLPTLAPDSLMVDKSAPPVFVSAVGRAADGAAELALSTPMMLDVPATSRASIDYQTTRSAATGESGGPLFVEGTHRLIAVYAHSDTSGKAEAWARLDGEVYTWITQKVSSHGGWTVTALP